MKAFHFSLEPVLVLRRETLEEWELKLARATGECVTLEKRIENNLNEIERVNTSVKENVESLMIRSRFIARMTQENGKTQLLLDQKVKERDKIRDSYNEAYRQCQALEKLKEKKREEYHKQKIKEEFKTIDDLNNGAKVRNAV